MGEISLQQLASVEPKYLCIITCHSFPQQQLALLVQVCSFIRNAVLTIKETLIESDVEVKLVIHVSFLLNRSWILLKYSNLDTIILITVVLLGKISTKS